MFKKVFARYLVNNFHFMQNRNCILDRCSLCELIVATERLKVEQFFDDSALTKRPIVCIAIPVAIVFV